jgi:hypothetical protein
MITSEFDGFWSILALLDPPTVLPFSACHSEDLASESDDKWTTCLIL